MLLVKPVSGMNGIIAAELQARAVVIKEARTRGQGKIFKQNGIQQMKE